VVEDPKALKRTRGGRERLLVVATELFEAHSVAGTSLQMIADRLGVSKPAIYHHFRSRDEIIGALMEPVFVDARAGVEHLEALSDGKRRRAAPQFYADFVVRHRRIINLVFFDRGALAGGLAETVDELVDGVGEMLASSHETVRVDLGITLVYGAAALATRRQDLDDEQLREVLVAVLGAKR